MTIQTDRLISAIVLIAIGVGQITQFLGIGNFPPGLILICIGVMYILESR
jgi:hypothetical protein